MKRNIKKLPTRRRKALTRLGWILGIVAFLSVFRLYYFLPSQALYEAEERQNLGRTEVVILEKGLDLEFTTASRMYLSVWEDTVLLTGMRFRPLTGWDSGPVVCRDLPAEEPVSGYAWTPYGVEGRSFALGYVCVDDPAITAADIRLQGVRAWDSQKGEWTREDVFRIQSEASEWTESGGRRYLLLNREVEWPEELEWGPFYMVVTAFDAQGNVVAEYDSYWADWIG